MNFITNDDSDIFEPFKRLIETDCGEKRISENNTLLRFSILSRTFLRRFLLERRLRQLPGLARTAGGKSGAFLPDKV